MRHPNVNSIWILSFQPDLADVFLVCHRHCGSPERIRGYPQPHRSESVGGGQDAALRLHDLARKDI